MSLLRTTALLLTAALAALPATAQKPAEAVPRAVASRGPLGADEQANIDLFKRVSAPGPQLAAIVLRGGGEQRQHARAAR
jgi:hypothetical protein